MAEFIFLFKAILAVNSFRQYHDSVFIDGYTDTRGPFY